MSKQTKLLKAIKACERSSDNYFGYFLSDDELPTARKLQAEGLVSLNERGRGVTTARPAQNDPRAVSNHLLGALSDLGELENSLTEALYAAENDFPCRAGAIRRALRTVDSLHDTVLDLI